MSQILMVWSCDPLAMQVPSGWNLTELTHMLWSWKVLMLDFEVTSQSFTVVSSDPDAINLVSGENSADLTQFE